MRKCILPAVAVAVVLTAGVAPGQTPAAAPAFEVASVKPAGPLNPAMIASGQVRIGSPVDLIVVDRVEKTPTEN